MKKKLILAAMAAASLVANTSIAQTNTNLFPAFISVTCVSTNAGGEFVYDRDRVSGFIQDFAATLGITTNLTNFSFVYNRSNNTLQVISGTNQTLVGTALTFTNGLSITNSNHTRVEFQWNVRVGTNSATTGTLTGTQQLGTTNDPTSFLLTGRLAYIEPASGTNAPAICRGILVVSNRDFDDDGDNNGNNGNNGHHGEGNHGNGLGNGGPIGPPKGNGNNGNNGNGHGH